MKKELQEKLFKSYPAIFRQKDLDRTVTAMCYGIACGDGWYDLIDQLCGEIQNQVDNVNRNRRNKLKLSARTLVPVNFEEITCEATQVKEKFGGLRFYVEGGDEYISGAIAMAESLSYQICTECGCKSDVDTQKNRGWIYTLCKSCKSARADIKLR